MVAKISKFGKQRNRVFEGTVASVVFVFVLLGMIGFFLYQNITTNQKRSVLEKRLQELQMEMSALEIQRQELEASVREADTEEYQEKILREQGLYKKQGEEVVTILSPEEAAAEASQEEKAEERKWWNPFSWF